MASVPFRLQPRWYRLPPLASRIFLLTSLHAFTLPQESLRRKRRDVPTRRRDRALVATKLRKSAAGSAHPVAAIDVECLGDHI
ncbi:MAG: hypothetical protein ACREFS_05875, partial [Acetobacteraceae bacterium]